MGNTRDPKITAAVVGAIRLGATVREAAASCGVSFRTARRISAEGGAAIRPAPNGRNRHSLVIPRWVPADLRTDFLDNRRLYGEIHAARLARIAKAEVARPEI